MKSRSLGSWITLAHPAIAEIMARAGFDWLVIDLEHSVITIREAEELIRIIELYNVKPYVRLTSNDPNQIKRVMDAGAHGIIVPMVKTLKDVENTANALFYPPKGTRSIGLARAQQYGVAFHEYVKKNVSHDLIIQVEHIDAIDNLEEILSFKGLDGFIVGPYDLSGSMGIPGDFNNPNFQAKLEKIRYISSKYPHIKRGFHLVEPCHNQLRQLIHEKYDFIAYGVDFRFLDASIRNGLSEFRRMQTEELIN